MIRTFSRAFSLQSVETVPNPFLFSQTHTHTQLYYAYCGFSDPMCYKSGEQQLLKHNRHPIFLGPLIILWTVPVMTYDRLLLAVMLPLYVGCGSIIRIITK